MSVIAFTPINEVIKMRNQNGEPDEDETNEDYGIDDNEGGEPDDGESEGQETPEDDDQTDNPEDDGSNDDDDYNLDDDDYDLDDDTDNPDDISSDGENQGGDDVIDLDSTDDEGGEDDTIDLDGEDDNTSDDDYNLDDTEDSSGGEDNQDGGGDDDYSIDGSDSGDGGEGSEDDSAGQEDGGQQQSGVDSDLMAAEDELFSSLTDNQRMIKTLELKSNMSKIYEDIENTIDKINTIPKTNDNTDVLSKVISSLTSLKDMVIYYIENNYDNSSYIENKMVYNKYLVCLKSISNILTEICKKEKPNSQ